MSPFSLAGVGALYHIATRRACTGCTALRTGVPQRRQNDAPAGLSARQRSFGQRIVVAPDVASGASVSVELAFGRNGFISIRPSKLMTATINHPPNSTAVIAITAMKMRM